MKSTVTRLSLCLLLALVCFALVPGASALNSSGEFAVAGNHTLGSSLSTPGAVVGSFVLGPIKDRRHKRESVPEGGSAAAYLLLAGASCLGAIALQSRRRTA